FFLCSLAYRQGIDAIGKWHDPAGYVVLLLTLAALWALSRMIRRFEPGTGDEPVRASSEGFGRMRQVPAVVWVAILGWLCVSELATKAWYRMHETGVMPAPKWTAQWPQENPTFLDYPINESTRVELRYNEGRSAKWTESGSTWQMFFFRWHP